VLESVTTLPAGACSRLAREQGKVKKPSKQHLVRKGIAEIKPYIPGKPVQEVKRELGLEDVIKLASNENPLGPSRLALEAIKAALQEVHLYPDAECYELREAVAASLHISADQLIFGNGGEELITLIGKAFINEGDSCVISRDVYDAYESVVRIMGGKITYSNLVDYRIDLKDMLEKTKEKTKIVFICNPMNPTGTIVTRQELEPFLEQIPQNTLVVLDEAYSHFVSDRNYPDGIHYVQQGKNVIVLRTFSKIYGLGGIRIGYGVAHPELIQYLRQVKEPFNVNTLAQVGALAALRDGDHVNRTLNLVRTEKTFLYDELSAMGIRFIPSEANFIFIDVGMDAKSLFQEMLKRGIIIRPGDIWNLPNFVRLTIGTREQNLMFIKALKDVRDNLLRTASSSL
jgi:histidinol-phosphate aminotransferase